MLRFSINPRRPNSDGKVRWFIQRAEELGVKFHCTMVTPQRIEFVRTT